MKKKQNIIAVDFKKKKKTNILFWRYKSKAKKILIDGAIHEYPIVCVACEKALVGAIDKDYNVVLLCPDCRKYKVLK